MWKNLLKSSIRSIHKNASSSFINFIGLILGFGVTLVIGIYIHHELTYDQYHANANRIFRVTHNEKAGEIPGIRHLATVGPPLGPALKETFTQIEDAVRFRYSPDRIIAVDNQEHYESRVFYVDPSIFNVFSFPLEKGNETTALSLPNNVVITNEMAAKYFGNNDPIGKILLMDNSIELKVTGVLAPLPSNTHLKFDFLLPFEAFKVPYGFPVNLSSWGWISFHTYVLLKESADPTQLENALPEIVKAHWPEDRAKKFKLQLQPLSDIYLGDVTNGQVASGNKMYLIVLAIAAILILVLATFNYTNLFTAISITRAKEMGVRKIIGAKKNIIAGHMIAESICLALLAGSISLTLLPSAFDYLNGAGFDIHFQNNTLLGMMSLVIFTALVIGVIAALYPSYFLSAFHHQVLLKGSFRTSPRGVMVRRILIFTQFCITIALVSSVFIINKQMTFINKKDLGYAKDELLLLRMPGDELVNRFSTLKSRLLQHPEVMDVSLGGGRMDGENGNVPIYVEGNLDEGIPMSISAATFDFFKTIGVSVVAGREISEANPSDTLRGVILNEAAARTFGWTPEEAIGKKIRIGEIVLDGEIIGVVPDFHFGLLRSGIQPLVMSYPRTHLQDIYVHFKAGTNISELVTSIQNDWNSIAPEFPFDFAFLNEHLKSQYKSEAFFALLFQFFAIVAIAISSLGLFGLVSQDVVFMVKEIGIRKVLGASVRDVTIQIMKPFVILILIANAIAWPISWIGMNSWLSEFSYHTSISWIPFAVAGLLTLFIAMFTISYKTIKAGQANPVKSLRSE